MIVCPFNEWYTNTCMPACICVLGEMDRGAAAFIRQHQNDHMIFTSNNYIALLGFVLKMNWCKIYCSWLDLFRFLYMKCQWKWETLKFSTSQIYLFCVCVWVCDSHSHWNFEINVYKYFIHPIFWTCLYRFNDLVHTIFFLRLRSIVYIFAWGFLLKGSSHNWQNFNWLVSKKSELIECWESLNSFNLTHCFNDIHVIDAIIIRNSIVNKNKNKRKIRHNLLSYCVNVWKNILTI